MSIIGNILWLVFGGLFVFLEYVLAGFLLCLTIIGIPFGIQYFKLGALALWPFGREVYVRPAGMGALSVVMNILWIILFGLAIALSHVVLAVLLALTIIGLPFAIQHLKLARLAFTPFGLEIT
jgi:uncharacterized membrane protein YccF (DUF307 family)